MAARVCFVIMPIRKPGTTEFEHFRTIRDTIIQPALVALGYDVVRADDINQVGAITADIIERLAGSELVVADLTDLNPNVFYELGVRHVLRKKGTIMLVDETRSEIPFDLAPYRVIKYQPTLAGAEHVRQKLQDFAAQDFSSDVGSDNPVHTYIPHLPADILAQVSGTTEGKLRAEIDSLRKLLKRYETEYGKLGHETDQLSSVLDGLILQAREGLLPDDLMAELRSSVERRDTRAFLEICRTLLMSSLASLSTAQYAEVAGWCSTLGLTDLESAVVEAASKRHPDDAPFERIALQSLAHSTDARIRQTARERYQRILGLRQDADARWTLPEVMARTDRITLGVMLDAFHRDGMHKEALQMADQLVGRYPDCDIALRNYARALEQNGAMPEAIIAYRAAVTHSQPDEAMTARWFGSTLFTLDRYLDAAEVQAIAAVLDPNDGENFLDVASSLRAALRAVELRSLPFLDQDRMSGSDARAIPADVNSDLVHRLLAAAFAAPQLSAADVQQALHQFDSDVIKEMLQARQGGTLQQTREERLRFASEVYGYLKSRFTTDLEGIRVAFQSLRGKGELTGPLSLAPEDRAMPKVKASSTRSVAKRLS